MSAHVKFTLKMFLPMDRMSLHDQYFVLRTSATCREYYAAWSDVSPLQIGLSVRVDEGAVSRKPVLLRAPSVASTF